jgi:cytoskeletal protein RodZ
VKRLDPNQVEKLQAISTQLRQAREEQGMTLEELAAKTYISMGALRALDAGQADLLPEPVFIQGFIRRYGDTVHLDGAALAQTFPLETAPPPPENLESVPVTESSAAEKSEKRLRLTGLAGGALASAVLLLGGVALLNRPKAVAPALQAQKSAPTSSPKPTQSQNQTLATSQPQNNLIQSPAVGGQQPAPAHPAASIEAAINLTQESWVQVIVDGQTAFEGTLPQGAKKTWTAKQQLTLLTGNAGGVVVAVNHGSAKPLGQPGEVKEVTFTPDSLSTDTTSSEVKL